MLQILSKFLKTEIRPAIIERLTDSAEIEALDLVVEGDETIEELAYMGTPIESCNGYDAPKWLIQIYLKTDKHEYTGYPFGVEEFRFKWSDRTKYEYRINKNLPQFVRRRATNILGEGAVLGEIILGE